MNLIWRSYHVSSYHSFPWCSSFPSGCVPYIIGCMSMSVVYWSYSKYIFLCSTFEDGMLICIMFDVHHCTTESQKTVSPETIYQSLHDICIKAASLDIFWITLYIISEFLVHFQKNRNWPSSSCSCYYCCPYGFLPFFKYSSFLCVCHTCDQALGKLIWWGGVR